MPRLLRLTVGALVISLLWYFGFALAWKYDVREPRAIAALITIIGLVGGLVMRSWLAVVVVPATLIGTVYLRAAIICARADCPPASDNTPFALFMLQLIYSGGPAALGASIGTLIATTVIPASLRRLW